MTRSKVLEKVESRMVLMKLKQKNKSLQTNGLACLVLSVTDPEAAAKFYRSVFGLNDAGRDVLPSAGTHVLLSLGNGQRLALAHASQCADLSETGVHSAFRVASGRRAHIAEALGKLGIAVHDYHEDRAGEAHDNFYFFDPDGNRIQVVERPGTEDVLLDHCAVLANDILWAEEYYVRVLGLPVEGRIGWNTADHARARRWAAGEENMAPGTRRLDKLYMMMGGKNEVPRANMQLFLSIGSSSLVVYLATKHYQEPPEGALTGAPRIILTSSRGELDRVAELMHATGWPCRGPVAHGKDSPFAASLYLRDPSGNFIELAAE